MGIHIIVIVNECLQAIVEIHYEKFSRFLQVHAGCQSNINQWCNFGNFNRLVLPPFCVSVANIPLWVTKFSGDAARKMSGLVFSFCLSASS